MRSCPWQSRSIDAAHSAKEGSAPHARLCVFRASRRAAVDMEKINTEHFLRSSLGAVRSKKEEHYMKRKSPHLHLLAGLILLLCLLCTACGSTEEPSPPQDNPDDGSGALSEDSVNDFSPYEGIWLGDEKNEYDYMEIDAEGNWSLYAGGDVAADGYLQYEPEWEAIYAYNYQDGSGGRFVPQDDGRLYISTYGYFSSGEGAEYLWYENGSGTEGTDTGDDAGSADGTDSGYSSYDSIDISSLTGIWYYEGDLASDSFLVIDDNGGWSLYQRAPGAENAEVDSGWISDAGEANTFYADSAVYDGVSYRMYVFETDVMMWGGEDDYYERME